MHDTMWTDDFLQRLSGRIGQPAPPVTFTLGQDDALRWADAIDDPDPRWSSEAPPTLLVSRRPDIWDDLFPEATEFGTHWLNGGDSLTLSRAIPLQVPIRCTMTITDIETRKGRSSDFLLFSNRSLFETLQGEHLCTILGSMIRR